MTQTTNYQLNKFASTDTMNPTTLNGLNDNADKLESALSNLNMAYCTCNTGASTVEKTITIASPGNWVLGVGSILVIKFDNTNTANNPTFKVGSYEAKSVAYNTGQITTSNLNKARICE